MKKRIHRSVTVSLTAWAVLAFAAGNLRANDLSPDHLKMLKAATVYVKVEHVDDFPEPIRSTGSGFVIHVHGATGLIVTNHHVIQTPIVKQGKIRQSRYFVVFDSGLRQQKTMSAELVGSDPIYDLALLRVNKADNLPKAIPLPGNAAAPLETTTYYAFGFPFGKQLSLSKKDPAVTVGKGTVSSVREDDFGQIREIQLDGDINPGNSGGPIVGADGKLMGIVYAHVVNSRIGLAIPPTFLQALLRGSVANIRTTPLHHTADGVELAVEADVIAPFSAIKNVRICYLSEHDFKDRSPWSLEKDVWAPIKTDKQITLNMVNGKAKGKLILPAKTLTLKLLVCQASWDADDGKNVRAMPQVCAADLSLGMLHNVLPGGLTFVENFQLLTPLDLSGFPSHDYRVKLEAGKRYEIDMASKTFHAVLFVDDQNGQQVAQSQNGIAHAARVVLDCKTTGTYRIVASSARKDALGKYDLTIKAVAAAPALAALAPNLPPAAQPAVLAGKMVFESKLTNADVKDRVRTNSYSKVFEVQMKKGQGSVIDLMSVDFDAYLRVEDADCEELAFNDDGGAGFNSRLRFVAPRTATYRLIATTFAGAATGNFTMTVRPE